MDPLVLALFSDTEKLRFSFRLYCLTRSFSYIPHLEISVLVVLMRGKPGYLVDPAVVSQIFEVSLSDVSKPNFFY